MNTMRETISPQEAAKRLGRSVAFVQNALRDGTFPVGAAVRTQAGEYAYIIPRVAFERFMNGDTVSQTLIERLASAVERAVQDVGRKGERVWNV